MKKKKIIVLLTLSFLIFLSGTPQFTFEASSGKLRAASICTGNDGIKYGSHGDGHWHRATKHKNGWYPQKGSLGSSNPCKSIKTQTMKKMQRKMKPKNNKSTQMKKNKSKSKRKKGGSRQMKKRKARKY